MLTPTLFGNFKITFVRVSQFKHVPLYLEWAPLGVFSGKAEEKDEERKKDEQTRNDQVHFQGAKLLRPKRVQQCYC